MPKEKVVRRARQARREGKAPSTQASEFVREKMRELGSKTGPKSRKQAIAIGLDEARRAGVPLPPPPDERAAQGDAPQAANAERPTGKPRSWTRARTARTGQKRTAQKRKDTRAERSPRRPARKGAAKASARGRTPAAKRQPAKSRASTASRTGGGRARTASGQRSRGGATRTRT